MSLRTGVWFGESHGGENASEVRAVSVQELVRRVDAASFRGGSRRTFTNCLCLACLDPGVGVEATVDWVTWIVRHARNRNGQLTSISGS